MINKSIRMKIDAIWIRGTQISNKQFSSIAVNVSVIDLKYVFVI